MKENFRAFFTGLKYTLTFFLIATGAVFCLFTLLNKNEMSWLVVQSGSMKPTIDTGAIILIAGQKQENFLVSPINLPFYYLNPPLYQTGEIVTYKSGKETFTHRIVSVETKNNQFIYETKGDANKGSDVEKVTEKQILGKVIFYLPYVGYLVAYAKTQQGLILLVIIPTTIIVYAEILKIKEEIKKALSGNKQRSYEISNS